MKWIVLIIIAFVVLSTRRNAVGELARTVKKLPKDFKDGQKAVDDPAMAAKPVNEPPREG